MKRPLTRREEQKAESSLNRFHGEAAASSIENAGIAYQSPSIIASGAEAQGVAMLSFLSNLVLSIFCIQTPRITAKLGSTKRAVTFLALIDALTWLPLVFVFLFRDSINPAWLVALWVFNLIPTMLAAPLRDAWLVDMLPGSGIGRYFGIRSAISGVAYLATFYLTGYVLDRFYGAEFMGFSAIFALAFAASLTSFLLYRGIQSPPPLEKKDVDRTGFGSFLGDMKRGNLGTFIMFISMFSLSVSLCGPLFSVYMLKDLQLSYFTFTAIVSAEYIARIASVSFWGKYADRLGTLRILGIAARLIPFIPILWLFSSDVGYLIGVQLVSGTLWAGFDLCSQTFIYKAAPQSKRLKYIVYHKSLHTFAMALGALTGAFLLTYIAPVFGSKILGLFLVSGVSRLLVVLFMFHKLVDLTFIPDPRRVKSPVDLEAALRTADLRQGLFYYRPQSWVESLGGAMASGVMMTARVEPSQKGLLYQPKKWKLFLGRSEKPEAAAEAAVSPKHSLFHMPHKWNLFTAKSRTSGIVAAEAVPVPVPSTDGLFYRATNWKEPTQKLDSGGAATSEALEKEAEGRVMFHELKKPKQPVAVEPEAETEAIASNEGLLYRPQSWKQFVPEPQAEAVGAASEPAASKEGLFYRTSDWKQFVQKLDSGPADPETPEMTPSSRGLLHRPQSWRKFVAKPQAEAAKTAPDPAPSRDGLFYRTSNWREFIRKLDSQTPDKAARTDAAMSQSFQRKHAIARAGKTSPPVPSARAASALLPKRQERAVGLA